MTTTRASEASAARDLAMSSRRTFETLEDAAVEARDAADEAQAVAQRARRDLVEHEQRTEEKAETLQQIFDDLEGISAAAAAAARTAQVTARRAYEGALEHDQLATEAEAVASWYRWRRRGGGA